MKKLIYMTIAATLVFAACKKDNKTSPNNINNNGGNNNGGNTVSNKVKTITYSSSMTYSLSYNAGLLSKVESSGSTSNYIWNTEALTITDVDSTGTILATSSCPRNSAGYVVSVSFSGVSNYYTESYTYDSENRITQVTQGSSTMNYSWSGGNLVSVVNLSGSGTIAYSYTYEYLSDKDNRDMGLKYLPNGNAYFPFGNGYSSVNLVKSIKYSGLSYPTKYTYQKDGNGRVIQETATSYYMNGSVLDSTMNVTEYTYY
ncbi:MAG: hypothetical protein KF900_02580 [Bacteroidetes bacterium]|nr:hypothetical protein [Bacteroidota bacterium]